MGVWDSFKAGLNGAAGVDYATTNLGQGKAFRRDLRESRGSRDGTATRRATARRAHLESVDIGTYLAYMTDASCNAEVLIKKDLGPAIAGGRAELVEWASKASVEIAVARKTIEERGSQSLFALQIGKAYCQALQDYEGLADVLLKSGGRLTSRTDAMLRLAWDDWDYAIRLINRVNPAHR